MNCGKKGTHREDRRKEVTRKGGNHAAMEPGKNGTLGKGTRGVGTREGGNKEEGN
jgi:hypothetical protein